MLVLSALILAPVLASGAYIPAPINTVPESTTTADNQNLIQSLELAATAVDRRKLLNDGSDFLFDFTNPAGSGATTTGAGGHTVKVDRKLMPALVGTGVSMTLGFLGPCGFNTPHTHPRSSEINVVVEGALMAEMIPENGAGIVRNRVDKFHVTVFPQGAVHTEFNPDCGNATFVAGFASEDPGVQQSAQTFFGLDDNVIQAALGSDFTFPGTDIDKFAAAVPPNVALGVKECLAKCNIKKPY